jgi:Flp pilus assembly protein TadD
MARMVAEPLCTRAQLLLDDAEDRHDEAIAVLRSALAEREPSALRLLVRAYRERGYRAEIIELLTPRASAAEPDLAAQLGDALAAAGASDRAEDAYELAVSGGDVAAMNSFGVFLRHRNRLKEAERMLLRAAEAGDDMAPVNLVEVQWEGVGDPRVATRTAERWADESRPTTLLGLAYARACDGRYDEAEVLYRRAAELGGYRGHIEYAMFMQEARDDVDAAEREFQAAGEAQEPGWALAYGRFLVDCGRKNESREYLEHAAYWGDLEALRLIEELDTGDAYDD